MTILFKFNVYIELNIQRKPFPASHLSKISYQCLKKQVQCKKLSINPKKIKNQEETINQVKTLITEFPSLSIQKMASAVQVSTKIVFNIINNDLHLKPYKIQDWHKLEVHDYAKRVEFATWGLSIGPDLKKNKFKKLDFVRKQAK